MSSFTFSQLKTAGKEDLYLANNVGKGWTSQPVVIPNWISFWGGLSLGLIQSFITVRLLLGHHANIGVCTIFVTPLTPYFLFTLLTACLAILIVSLCVRVRFCLNACAIHVKQMGCNIVSCCNKTLCLDSKVFQHDSKISVIAFPHCYRHTMCLHEHADEKTLEFELILWLAL